MNSDISHYIADVKNNFLPNMTREEEIMYFRREKQGDASARDAIIRSNLRFVIRIVNQTVNKYKIDKFALSDLIQEGNLLMYKALDKFDPERGYRFQTYLGRSIEWLIKDFYKKQLADSRRLNIYAERGSKNLEKHQTKLLVEDLISTLDERSASIIKMHYGLGEPKLTLKEIGKRINKSHESVRKIEKEVLKKLSIL